MPEQYNVICCCEFFIYAKIIHLSLLSWNDRYLKELKYQSLNDKKIRSGEKANIIYETCKNTMLPHGRHIYSKASDMEKVKM